MTSDQMKLVRPYARTRIFDASRQHDLDAMIAEGRERGATIQYTPVLSRLPLHLPPKKQKHRNNRVPYACSGRV